MKVTTTNRELAELARAEVGRHKKLTRERCAAAALWVALGDTETVDSARRALATFGTPQTQHDALELLGQLVRTIASDHQDHDGTTEDSRR